jgi:hypothetical protein
MGQKFWLFYRVNRIDLGMSGPVFLVPAFANNLSIVNNNTANHWVGSYLTAAFERQFQSPLHEFLHNANLLKENHPGRLVLC